MSISLKLLKTNKLKKQKKHREQSIVFSSATIPGSIHRIDPKVTHQVVSILKKNCSSSIWTQQLSRSKAMISYKFEVHKIEIYNESHGRLISGLPGQHKCLCFKLSIRKQKNSYKCHRTSKVRI